jgi:hypothetical protein
MRSFCVDRAGFVTITVALAVACSTVSPTGDAPESSFAFIGVPIAAERSPKSCQDYLPTAAPGAPQEVCMDRAFLLRYQVLEWISESRSDSVVDMVGFYHYWGLPEYTRYEPALVVAGYINGHLRMRRIEQVWEEDGGWWVCEEWPEDPDLDCVRGRFVEEIVLEMLE